MFNKDIAVVKSWVSLTNSGRFAQEQVPALFNLREVVVEIINAK